MLKAEVKNNKGKKVGDINLSEDVFGIKIKESLVHQAYSVQYSNRRSVIAHTKDRSERAGSGRKPWRQKGTGRARVGDVRTPIWRKGGVVFGPSKERNFGKKITKKMKNKAERMVLSGKLADGELIILENLKLEERKTKHAGRILENLKLNKSVLWAFSKKEKENAIATRNLKNVKNISIDNINVFDMLNSKFLLLTKEGIENIEKKFLNRESDSEEMEKPAKEGANSRAKVENK